MDTPIINSPELNQQSIYIYALVDPVTNSIRYVGKSTDIDARYRRHTEDAKRKISEAGKGNKYTLGYKHSDATRKKFSEAQKGHTVSSATRRKIGDANRRKAQERKSNI